MRSSVNGFRHDQSRADLMTILAGKCAGGNVTVTPTASCATATTLPKLNTIQWL